MNENTNRQGSGGFSSASPTTVFQILESARLPALNTGSDWLAPYRIEAWLGSHRQKPEPQASKPGFFLFRRTFSGGDGAAERH